MRQSVKGIDFSAADCLRSNGALLEPETLAEKVHFGFNNSSEGS